MPLLDPLLNVGANAMADAATHLALHTADPGTTGTNQAASARVPANWSAASGGDITATDRAFTGGTPGGPVTHVGLWSAATGGTFYGAFPLSESGDRAFNAAGELTLTSLTVNGSST